MRPLTVLTGIVLGSAAAATFALVATLVVFAFLIDEYPQFRSELPLLAVCTLGVAVLTGLAAFSFIGQVRERPWRWWSLAGMWGLLATIVLSYVRVRLQR